MKKVRSLLCLLLALVLMAGFSGCVKEISGADSYVSPSPAPENVNASFVAAVVSAGGTENGEITAAFTARFDQWGLEDIARVAEVRSAETELSALEPSVIVAVGALTEGQRAAIEAEGVPVLALGCEAFARSAGALGTVPEAQLLEVILQACPALERLGLLYDGADASAAGRAAAVKALCESQSIAVTEGDAAETLEDAQAVYTPGAADAGSLGLPWFTEDPEQLKNGALCAVAVDREWMGRAGADIIAALAAGELLENVQAPAPELLVTVNRDAAAALDLELPGELLDTAVLYEAAASDPTPAPAQ